MIIDIKLEDEPCEAPYEPLFHNLWDGTYHEWDENGQFRYGVELPSLD